MVKKQLDLNGSDEEDTSSTNQLNINKQYAERYENWRSKEEFQKRKSD
jgi:hypothetical protein